MNDGDECETVCCYAVMPNSVVLCGVGHRKQGRAAVNNVATKLVAVSTHAARVRKASVRAQTGGATTKQQKKREHVSPLCWLVIVADL